MRPAGREMEPVQPVPSNSRAIDAVSPRWRVLEVPMSAARWVALAALAMLAGYFLVRYLVSPTQQVGLYAILLALAVALALVLVVVAFRGWSLAWALLLVLAAVPVGWSVANAQLLAREEQRALPAVTRTDGGDGHSAVLYFTHGEPPGYSAQPWIDTIRELDHDGVPFVPWLVRPLFFNAVRTEYALAGGSAHNKLHATFIDDLARSMPEESAAGTRFYLAFLDSNPRPDEMTIRAINDGASRIVILPVFVTESTHTEAGREMVAGVGPEQYGVTTCYTGALWDSEPLQESFVQRANELLDGTDKARVGILLVGHGQPTQWEEIYPAQNAQESQYREAIRDRLVADGFPAENVALGWMEFQQPSITSAVRALADVGVERILVLAVSLSADSIHSDVDVPHAVAEAGLPAGITVEFVGQYGDHPLAIRAMAEKVRGCLTG